MEFAESPVAAVAREFLEETGAAAAVKELVGSFSLVSVLPADTGSHLVLRPVVESSTGAA